MFRFAILIAAFFGCCAFGAQPNLTHPVHHHRADGAFKAVDFAQAFTYAPNIKGMFGTADRFGMMVRNGYPMVTVQPAFDI